METRLKPQLSLSLDTSGVRSWAGYPLSVIPNADPLAPDLFLKGQLPVSGAIGYRLSLDPWTSYRFSADDGTDSTQEAAVVVDAATGKVQWANRVAADALDISDSAALVFESDLLTGQQRADVTLVVGTEAAIRAVAGLAPLAEDHTSVALPDKAAKPGLAEPYSVSVLAQEPAFAHDTITRFVKTATQQYFYTANQAEADLIRLTRPEFRWEGVVFSADAQERPGWEPVFRFADLVTGGYFYTAKLEEAESMGAKLRAEGIAFWAPPAEAAITTPVYRLFNMDTGGYLFTENPVEKLYAVLQGNWRDEGVAFNALANPVAADAAIAAVLGAELPELSAVGVAAPPDIPLV